MSTDNQQRSSKFRKCKKCEQVKTFNDFQIYNKQKGWRRHECNECLCKRQAAWAKDGIKAVCSSHERTCKKCEKTKPIDDFAPVYAKNSRGQNYRQHTCLDCFRFLSAAKERRLRKANPERYKQASRKYWKKHREKKLAQRREADRELRNTIFDAYGGYECKCCGETEKNMLTLDHINNDGGRIRKENPKLRTSRSLYLYIIENGFPGDLQILCYNCNISKYRNKGICSHKLRERSETIRKE